jgi:hypothetical protein
MLGIVVAPGRIGAVRRAEVLLEQRAPERQQGRDQPVPLAAALQRRLGRDEIGPEGKTLKEDFRRPRELIVNLSKQATQTIRNPPGNLAIRLHTGLVEQSLARDANEHRDGERRLRSGAVCR